MAKEPVRAAGGIVWRTSNGKREVLVVHRPLYNDWSFPKGKNEPGEPDLSCAVREIEEETGLHVTAGATLPTVEYIDHKGRQKEVAYWAMTVVECGAEGTFVPNDEVDEMRWVSLDEANAMLSYPIDQGLLGEFVSLADPLADPVGESHAG